MTTLTVRDQIRTLQLIHDIQSPLSAVRGYAQLLRRRLANDRARAADVEDGLRRIEESAARVGRLLDQFAESSASGSGGRVNREPIDLVHLARQVAAESEAAASNSSRVVVLPAVTELMGYWDVMRVERMLANLIGNALKYNREGRPVVVTVQRAGDSAMLSVADQGVGIPAAELPHVFERGYRASNVASEVDGLGLGLAGAKEAVTELSGAIDLQSHECIGTTVTVRLPFGEPPVSSGRAGSEPLAEERPSLPCQQAVDRCSHADPR
jgi:signal transduction histidine kinase